MEYIFCAVIIIFALLIGRSANKMGEFFATQPINIKCPKCGSHVIPYYYGMSGNLYQCDSCKEIIDGV